MPGSFELDSFPSSSTHYNRTRQDEDEDELDHRARLLSKHELDSESDNETDLDGMKSLRRDLEKMEQDEQDGGVEAMIRKAVSDTDDTSLPTLTFRVVFLGSIFCVLGAAASQLFFFKSNPPSFSSFFVILVTYPLGNMMARWLPRRRIPILGQLNPSPVFNIKEHLLVGVIASSGGSAAYASDILAILDLYYKTSLGAVAGITLLLTTQLIGFSLSGLLQDLLVKPASMYWPSALPVVTLYRVLHDKANTLTALRLRFFVVVFAGVFLYQFLPGFIFPTLTSLPLLCILSSPTPSILRTIGSGYEGLGFLDLSFDWGAVGSSGLLYTPFWALLNWFGGLIGMLWIITPIVYVFDIWDARSFPSAVSAGLFDKNFTRFELDPILTPALTLNETAFETAGPLLLTPYFALTYALSFASLSSVIVHVVLFHGAEIRAAFTKGRKGAEDDDIHNKMMKAYDEVPRRWYVAIGAVCLFASLLLVLLTPALQTPIWSLLLSLFIAIIFVVPIGVVSAVSGTTIGLNVLTEFVHGVLQPGRPVGNVFFKCFGYMSASQALNLTSDLKLALYLKVPYKDMFQAQVLGTVLGAVVNYVTLVTVIAQKRPFLDGTSVDPTGQWTGRAPAVFFSASVIWGLISPARFFAGKYSILYLGFPLGALVPFICYRLHRRYPNSNWDKVYFPIVCSGATLIPQAPSNILLTSFLLTLFVHLYLVKRHPGWSDKFLLTLSAALDAATSLNAMFVYVVFTGVLGGWAWGEWWGNPSGDSEHCRT